MFTKLLILFLTLFLTSACAGFLPKQAQSFCLVQLLIAQPPLALPNSK